MITLVILLVVYVLGVVFINNLIGFTFAWLKFLTKNTGYKK